MPGPNTNPYTEQSASGFNASPPVDDGSTTEANKVKYSTIKEKLIDPVKTLIDNIDDQNVSAFGKVINTDNDERNTIGGNIAYTSSELTISSGVVTQTRAHHTIDTESDASSDDLDRLSNSSADDGTIVYLRQEASGRDVTVKHQAGSGDGQFGLVNSEDFTIGTNGVLILMRDTTNTQWIEIARSSAATAAPRGYVAGLGISNDTDASHDIAIAAGICRNSDNSNTLSLSATLTKQIDAAWAVGDDAGGIDTGAVANTTWYYVHLIKRTDTGVVDALFSTSNSSPTMPTNYDKRQLIGAVLTDGSANILAFTQLAYSNFREYIWTDPPLDIDTTQNMTAASRTLSVPTAYKTTAVLNIVHDDDSLYASSLDANDEATSTTAAPLASFGSISLVGQGPKHIPASAGGQIRTVSSGAVGQELRITTLGWQEFIGGT